MRERERERGGGGREGGEREVLESGEREREGGGGGGERSARVWRERERVRRDRNWCN